MRKELATLPHNVNGVSPAKTISIRPNNTTGVLFLMLCGGASLAWPAVTSESAQSFENVFACFRFLNGGRSDFWETTSGFIDPMMKNSTLNN